MLNSTRHNFINSLIETKYRSIDELDDQLGLGSREMPSLKSVFGPSPNESTTVTTQLGKGKKPAPTEALNCEESSVIAESGIVRLNFTTPASVAIHAPNSKQRLSTEMMYLLRRDEKDF